VWYYAYKARRVFDLFTVPLAHIQELCMTVLANRVGCRYLHNGLTNVRLTGYPLSKEAGAVRIERINTLHRVIALGLVQKPGLLSREEIRSLRLELGYSQEDLADMVDARDRIIRMAERGQLPLAIRSDVELRRLIYTHFEHPMPPIDDLYALVLAPRDEEFLVRVVPDEEQIWKLAA